MNVKKSTASPWGTDLPWETNVLRTRRDAEAWVKDRVKEKFGIDDLTFD